MTQPIPPIKSFNVPFSPLAVDGKSLIEKIVPVNPLSFPKRPEKFVPQKQPPDLFQLLIPPPKPPIGFPELEAKPNWLELKVQSRRPNRGTESGPVHRAREADKMFVEPWTVDPSRVDLSEVDSSNTENPND